VASTRRGQPHPVRRADAVQLASRAGTPPNLSSRRGEPSRYSDLQPLYRQVCHHLEELALSQRFDDVSALPPEGQLVDRLGVSRGTLRRATDELARAGLLSVEPGRGTFVDKATQVRWRGWERLARVARPDSRFDLDISRFIPDFEGREICDELIVDLDQYKRSGLVFVAPDNSLQSLRESALGEGKRLIVPTSGMRRGIVALDGKTIPPRSRALAAVLDGMERFAQPLDLRGLRALGRIDLVVTGAVAVTEQGVHIDSGTGMFCLEWMLLAHLGVVNVQTPVVASVHACQVVPALVARSDTDAVVDLIATPGGLLRCRGLDKASGLRLEAVPHALFETVPYLNQLVSEGDIASHLVSRFRDSWTIKARLSKISSAVLCHT